MALIYKAIDEFGTVWQASFNITGSVSLQLLTQHPLGNVNSRGGEHTACNSSPTALSDAALIGPHTQNELSVLPCSVGYSWISVCANWHSLACSSPFVCGCSASCFWYFRFYTPSEHTGLINLTRTTSIMHWEDRRKQPVCSTSELKFPKDKGPYYQQTAMALSPL